MLIFEHHIRASILRANIRAAKEKTHREDNHRAIEALFRGDWSPSTEAASDEPGEKD